jgi:leucyl/phenylalanyl-tRNA--protein transferase
VLEGCRGRLPGAPARDGEWISPELTAVYQHLHGTGLAHSFEVWRGGELAGGILGLALGGAFIAESKFHRVTNASKVALVRLAGHLHARGFTLLDAQIQNPHLQTLGVHEVGARAYAGLLAAALRVDAALSP